MQPDVIPSRPQNAVEAGTWPDMDPSLVEERRRDAPPFPIDLMPAPWQAWIADTARSAGAPADYVALSALAAVAGLSGHGVVARVLPAWREEVVLRLALIGPASSGKSPAIDPMFRMLAGLEVELYRKGCERQPRLIVPEPDLAVLDEALDMRPHAVLAWRDEGYPCLTRLPHPCVPASVLGALSSDGLEKALAGANDGMASRFLYAWPDPPPYCRLLERRVADDGRAVASLRRLLKLPGPPEQPVVLTFDQPALAAFDDFLAGLHPDCRDGEGLLGAWLGKGPGAVVQLAAVVELLGWAAGDAAAAPFAIGLPAVQAAIALWRDYFRPHAALVFDAAGPDDLKGQARRVIRWLRSTGAAEITREQVRRQGLSFGVNAARADLVLGRLRAAGIVRPGPRASGPQGGRPAERWEVNPRLGAKRQAITALTPETSSGQILGAPPARAGGFDSQ